MKTFCFYQWHLSVHLIGQIIINHLDVGECLDGPLVRVSGLVERTAVCAVIRAQQCAAAGNLSSSPRSPPDSLQWPFASVDWDAVQRTVTVR